MDLLWMDAEFASRLAEGGYETKDEDVQTATEGNGNSPFDPPSTLFQWWNPQVEFGEERTLFKGRG
jgi:hypothetical protein